MSLIGKTTMTTTMMTTMMTTMTIVMRGVMMTSKKCWRKWVHYSLWLSSYPLSLVVAFWDVASTSVAAKRNNRWALKGPNFRCF